MPPEATAPGVSPGDWGAESERRYALAQAALADDCGVDVTARTAETDAGGTVHYLTAGDPDAEPVVLLHGLSTPAATWLPMLAGLVDDHWVVAPDRPGLGLSDPASYSDENLRTSMTAYLVELFDHLGLDRPAVVGNSLGGQQAFLLALDHGRVDSLCLVGAPGGVSKEFPLPWRLMTVRGVSRLLFWLDGLGDPEENAREATEQLLVGDDADAVSEAFYDLLAAAFQMPKRQQSLRSLQTAQGSFGRLHDVFDLTDELPRIECPTCFAWGSEDALWEPDVGRPVAESMPDAEFHVLDGHGHVPWLDPGDEAERVVREFLNE